MGNLLRFASIPCILLLMLPKTCFSQTEERITFFSNNAKLIGYLSKPANSVKFPLIIVAHSASHGHHDSNLYNHLEKTMLSQGIGVFTYDRRGSGESEGNAQNSSLTELAQDLLAAIEHLKNHEAIDHSKIGLYGISQGGWIAPLAFTLDPKDISFMILVSSSGVSPAEQMEYSAVSTLKMNGYDQDVIKKAKYLRNITNEYYRGKREKENTQKIIDQYRDQPWFSDVYLPWRGKLPENRTQARWYSEMDFEPMQYFKNNSIPTLIIYGEYDRWVPIDRSIEIWKSSLDRAGNSQYLIKRIPQSGHMMIIDEDKDSSENIISKDYENLLIEWSKKISFN